ncbi:MAG: hypothetical protein KF764_34810 [Labilithrix sp.]|nr:hypothetical protein [Labilithrix sp.]MBX3224152.1 hypothetical protein [Labilithrix sp.]
MRSVGRSPSSSFGRALGVALTIGSLGVVASATNAACIPDPEGDYKDFRERTANLGGNEPEPTVDASFDSKPPETAVEALYVGICVTSLAARDPAQALRFYAETKYTPDEGSPSTGKLSMSLTPMVGWDVAGNRYIEPASVSKSETRGDTKVVEAIPVTGGGRFTAELGTVTLAKEANSISGRDAVINPTTLDGLFGAGDRFCSTLGGLLTVPYSFTFDPKQNTCIFVKAKEGDPLPKLESAEFVCAF